MIENMNCRRARALVGTRFRAQGRDPQTGLDCVGLAIAAFALPAEAVRRDYRLRGDHGAEVQAKLSPWFRRISARQRRPGDLMLLRVARDQWHLALSTEAGFVHADAGIGKVVETPGMPPWKLAAVYRRRVRPPRSR